MRHDRMDASIKSPHNVNAGVVINGTNAESEEANARAKF